MNSLLLVAIVSLVLGCGLFGYYLYLDYKRKNEKSFVIIGLGLLAFYFFGGSIFIILAILLFLLLLVRGC
jgi:hypothetical protein